MSRTSIARKVYLDFSNYEGSQHIAAEFALYKLLELTKKFEIKSILEIGLGIGTIAEIILENRPSVETYFGTEANEFCLNSLKNNVSESNYSRLTILRDINELNDKDIFFDLIIVDGKSSELIQLKPHLLPNAIIAIEGDRQPQVDRILDIFPNALIANAVSFRRNHQEGVHYYKDWQGGIRYIFINPTFKQKLYYFKERVRSKLAYTYRKFVNRLKKL